MKPFKALSDELSLGMASLETQKDGRLMRTVDIVEIKVEYPGSKAVLVEAGWNWLPAVKRRPEENQFLAATRVLKEVCKMDPNYVVWDPNNVENIEDEVESVSFPMISKYRKRIITAHLQV